jgi:hypothetical protein
VNRWLGAILFLISVLIAFPIRVQAQDNPDVATGLIPYQSLHGGDIGLVNLTNGNVFVSIPLVSYPQRGGKLALSFSLIFNGKTAVVKVITPPKSKPIFYWDAVAASGGVMDD